MDTVIRKHLYVFIVLIMVAVSFRVAVVHWLPNDSADDSLGYAQIARNVLEQHVYSHATEAPFDPSYVRLPGYPLFLATIYSVFGHTNNSAVRIAQALIDAGTCALVAWLAFLWQPDERRKIATAIAAFTLAAVNPFTTIYAATILTEVPTTFLLVAACVAATIAFQSHKFEREVRCWAISGLLLGVGVLFRPDVGLAAASIGIALVVARFRLFGASSSGGSPKSGTPKPSRGSALSLRSKLSRIILAGAIFSFAFGLALAPWTIRNWRTFHVFQPLAPDHANMPGEYVILGYERWLKTWTTDGEFLDALMWNLDKEQIDIDDLPDSAFDSQAERDRVSDLFDQYNAGDDNSTDENEEPEAASSPSPSPSPDQPANKGQAAKANKNDNSDDQEDARDNESNGAQDNKTNNDQTPTMTPEIDAGFAQIARERIARHPLRYYLVLPARRAHALWFNTHSDFYPFSGNALPLNNPENSRAENFWLPVFAVLVAIYTLLGVAGFIWMLMSGSFYARAVMLMIFLICATRLALFSMAVSVEPRYVVEFFPLLSALAGIVIVEGWMRLRRNRHVSGPR